MDARDIPAEADPEFRPGPPEPKLRTLGRIKLGAEPLWVQVERYRRVTWALTVIPGLIALMFLALFSAFHAPLIGLAIGLLLWGPIAGFAWLDFLALERRVALYEGERGSIKTTAGVGETPAAGD